MARVMDGGFRRIKRTAPAAPVEDPRLALVGQFAAAQGADAQPDPADRALELLSVPQEPQEQPVPEPTDTAAPEASEGADETPSPEIEHAETPAPAETSEPETDYDPIAAVLG